MCGKVFVKRVLPFFLTFSIGIFIASFFVSIAAPSFQLPNRDWRRHQQCDRMREFQNQRLNEENSRLRRQLADKDLQDANDRDDVDFAVPPPPPMPPATFRTIPYRR